MNRLNIKRIAFFLILSSLFSAYAGGVQDTENDKLQIMVSILPQKYFVDQIAGNLAQTAVMIPPGKSPATYDPLPSQMIALGKSDAYFSIGVPFESNLLPTLTTSMPQLNVVASDKNIPKRMIEAHDHEEEAEDLHENDHENDHAAEHEEEALDPHVWMSPKNAVEISSVIMETLIQLKPEHEAIFTTNFLELKARLELLDQNLEETLRPLEGQSLLVYHPAFGYFADDYKMKQLAIETGGDEPTPLQLQHIINTSQTENVRIIIVQPEFSPDSAQVISQAIGAEIIQLSTLAYDYFENMNQISQSLAGY